MSCRVKINSIVYVSFIIAIISTASLAATQPATTAMSGLLTALLYRREDWRSVSIPTGVQFVMTNGMIEIPGWLADS